MNNRIILDEIHKRAVESFNGDPRKSGVLEWFKHWMGTARKWRDELRAEGLEGTARAVEIEIRYEQKNEQYLKDHDKCQKSL